MTFTTTTQALRQVLAAVMTTVPSKPIVKVLENLLIEVSPGKLSCTASNGEQMMTMSVKAETEDSGKFLINAKDFMSAARSANFDSVTVVTNDSDAAISSGFSEYALPILDSAPFPMLTFGNDSPVAQSTVSSNALRSAILRVSHVSLTDNTRPQLCGIRLDFKEDGLTSVATDTRILAKSFIDSIKMGTEIGITIPPGTIAMLQGAFLLEPEAEISIYTKGCILKCGENELRTIVINGNYPNYNRVIPQTYTTAVTFSRKDFLSALNAASVFGNTSTLANLMFGDSEVIMTVSDMDFRKSAKSRCKIERLMGGNLTINFNYKMLQSALKAAEADSVELRLTDAEHPGVFVGIGDESTLNLIMPMQGQ